MGWFSTSIRISSDTISIGNGLVSNSISWNGVSCIYGEKIDKITYDELFLILEDDEGKYIVAGEMDQGFAELESALYTRINGFSAHWRNRLESGAVGVRDQLWSKTK